MVRQWNDRKSWKRASSRPATSPSSPTTEHLHGPYDVAVLSRWIHDVIDQRTSFKRTNSRSGSSLNNNSIILRTESISPGNKGGKEKKNTHGWWICWLFSWASRSAALMYGGEWWVAYVRQLVSLPSFCTFCSCFWWPLGKLSSWDTKFLNAYVEHTRKNAYLGIFTTYWHGSPNWTQHTFPTATNLTMKFAVILASLFAGASAFGMFMNCYLSCRWRFALSRNAVELWNSFCPIITTEQLCGSSKLCSCRQVVEQHVD